MDKELLTVSWLDCETMVCAGKKFVNKLKCTVCLKFKEHICSTINFSYKWIDGADSICTSNIKDHALSQQHVNAMTLLKKEQTKEKGLDISTYAPIAQSMNTLAADDRERLAKSLKLLTL